VVRLVVVVALTTGSAGCTRTSRGGVADQPADVEPATRNRGERLLPGAPPKAPVLDQIHEEIERAPVASAADVDRYLDSLAARARSRGQVTALEVEPGLAMLRRYCPSDPAKADRFAERMLALQHQFAPAPTQR
jgi:hypothetical protein